MKTAVSGTARSVTGQNLEVRNRGREYLIALGRAVGCGVLALACAVTALALAPPAADIVRARAGWVRVLPGGGPCAGYMTLENSSDRPVELLHVAIPAFGRVELHQSYTTPDGNARMRQVDRLALPAHGVVHLAPGGYHLMLWEPREALMPGRSITATLTFANAAPIHVTLWLRPANYEPPGAPDRD